MALGYLTVWPTELSKFVLPTYNAALEQLLLPVADDTITATEGHIPDDPESREYIRKLLYYLLHGRDVAAYFNYIVLSTIAIFSAIHWHQKVQYARRRQTLSRKTTSDTDGPMPYKRDVDGTKDAGGEYSGDESPSSSSSCPSPGSRLVEEQAKVEDMDLERQPLLGLKPESILPKNGHWNRFKCGIRAWLMYQPRPIPIINRHLPSNGTTLFVLGYLAINVFLQLFQGSLRPEYEFAFADRAGCIFIVNLPLLYLLAAKNQPIKFLTGYSYEALNIFHRRVGEWMCFVAFVHSLGMLLDNMFFEVEWLRAGDVWTFLTRPLVLLGIGAFVPYELLFLTSLGSFRQRWYELFLASHVILQIAALGFLYLHFWTARPYVSAALLIFLADRLVWRLTLKTTTMKADLQILEDGKTFLLSANWRIPRRSEGWLGRFFGQSILHGWRPMDHVFITVPSLGRLHSLQTHPFTIASAAPKIEGPEDTAHAWFSLLIRAQEGFTGDLLRHASMNSTVAVRIDGPYGSADALEMLLASDTAVLIAGGSGIAVVFPLVWDLVYTHNFVSSRRRIHLFWVTHSRSHRSWMPQERLDELAGAGVHVTVPEPTEEAGRPDVAGYIDGLAARDRRRATELGVVVSGPDALNRAARNACASAVRHGTHVDLRVEKFGW